MHEDMALNKIELKIQGPYTIAVAVLFSLIFVVSAYSQSEITASRVSEGDSQIQKSEAPEDQKKDLAVSDAVFPAEAVTAQSSVPIETPNAAKPADAKQAVSSGKVTLDFKDADIKNVLNILSYKSGINIVAGSDVLGTVTMRLVDVPWEEALKTIVSTYGYGYDKRDNIIVVAPIDKLTAQKKLEVELSQVQPTVTEVFNLKYIDAGDAQKAIEPQLSARGKITALEATGQAGWEFGVGDEVGKRKRASEGRISRSKTLIITDIPPALDKIKKIISDIDVKPVQILIETKIVEANKDRLRDLGLDWGTGATGADAATMVFTPTSKKLGASTTELASHGLSDLITPSTFAPKASTITTANTGLRLAFKKLTGTQFEVILHALEEDVMSNTLSAPRILTINNQEATILVGQKYPLVKTDISTETGRITGSTLQKYQDIGIQLNVVPQLSDKEYINLIIHPAVTSYTDTLKIRDPTTATVLSEFPIINTREAETQVLIKDGETVVIGGLLKDVKSRGRTGIPFLGQIPILGFLFSRETFDIEKIDLLVFITARIVKEGEFTEAYLATLEERLDTLGPKKKAKKTKKPKKD